MYFRLKFFTNSTDKDLVGRYLQTIMRLPIKISMKTIIKLLMTISITACGTDNNPQNSPSPITPMTLADFDITEGLYFNTDRVTVIETKNCSVDNAPESECKDQFLFNIRVEDTELYLRTCKVVALEKVYRVLEQSREVSFGCAE